MLTVMQSSKVDTIQLHGWKLTKEVPDIGQPWQISLRKQVEIRQEPEGVHSLNIRATSIWLTS